MSDYQIKNKCSDLTAFIILLIRYKKIFFGVLLTTTLVFSMIILLVPNKIYYSGVIQIGKYPAEDKHLNYTWHLIEAPETSMQTLNQVTLPHALNISPYRSQKIIANTQISLSYPAKSNLLLIQITSPKKDENVVKQLQFVMQEILSYYHNVEKRLEQTLARNSQYGLARELAKIAMAENISTSSDQFVELFTHVLADNTNMPIDNKIINSQAMIDDIKVTTQSKLPLPRLILFAIGAAVALALAIFSCLLLELIQLVKEALRQQQLR
jgi:hypothetical protein